MLFGKDQKIVFIGDSITDCGRRDVNAPWGDGYMSIVRGFLLEGYPELGLSFENRGVSGDTIRHLAARWDRDVVSEQPDWLSVMIGINDVWRSHDKAGKGAVAIDEYESTYRELLQTAVDKTGCQLIIAEPYLIDPDRLAPMRAQMDEYGLVARRVATEFGAINVRTQEGFDAALAMSSPHQWSADKVHPNHAGHAVIALVFLRAIGFDWL